MDKARSMHPVPASFASAGRNCPKWDGRCDGCSCPFELAQLNQARNGPVSTLTQLRLLRRDAGGGKVSRGISKNASVSVARICTAFVLAIGAVLAGITTSVAAEYCPSGATEIATDRPDVTNSSVVVPQGALQIESGVNWTARPGNSVIDGPTSRVRLGVAPCTELLLDLPNYFHPVRGRGASGFSDLSLAIKHQPAPLPGEFQLSVTAGLELPTGAVSISGSGYGGYIQLPWSKEIGDGWSVSGMFTAFWFPGQRRSNPTLEPTFVVERQVGPRADMFIEYFADGPQHGISSQAIDSGGAYRLTSTQQVDFHAGFGLNRESPDFFFGVGYSLRLDGLFR